MMCSNSFLDVYFRVIPNIHFVSLSYLPIKTHVQKAEKIMIYPSVISKLRR